MNIFFSAFFGAILSTIPIGPINLILMQLILDRRWRTWGICVSAAVLADGLVCLLSLKFFDFVNVQAGPYLKNSPVILSVFLIASGALSLFSKQTSKASTPAQSNFAYFVFSFFLTLCGPALVPFWLSWWSAVHQTSPSLLLAAIGFILGDFGIFAFYALLVRLFPRPGFELQKKISKVLSIILIVIGILVLIGWMNDVSLGDVIQFEK